MEPETQAGPLGQRVGFVLLLHCCDLVLFFHSPYQMVGGLYSFCTMTGCARPAGWGGQAVVICPLH